MAKAQGITIMTDVQRPGCKKTPECIYRKQSTKPRERCSGVAITPNILVLVMHQMRILSVKLPTQPMVNLHYAVIESIWAYTENTKSQLHCSGTAFVHTNCSSFGLIPAVLFFTGKRKLSTRKQKYILFCLKNCVQFIKMRLYINILITRLRNFFLKIVSNEKLKLSLTLYENSNKTVTLD